MGRQLSAGRHVMVVGASEGIGRATAQELVRRGASVVLVARRRGPLDQATSELSQLATAPGQFVDTLCVDATDEEAVGEAVTAYVERRGVPGVLVCNVGSAEPRRVTEVGADDYRRALETNVVGQVIPFHALLPHFLAAGRGHTVVVSSMLGYFSIMGYATYAPTKFALVGWVETLRSELGPHGLTFGVLYPPDTLTPGYDRENLTKPPECRQMSQGVTPMSPEAVARVLVDGIERRRTHILPGDAALVWRLKRHLPRVLDLVLDRSHARARRALAEAAQS